jgi:hypothetical protein
MSLVQKPRSLQGPVPSWKADFSRVDASERSHLEPLTLAEAPASGRILHKSPLKLMVFLSRDPADAAEERADRYLASMPSFLRLSLAVGEPC